MVVFVFDLLRQFSVRISGLIKQAVVPNEAAEMKFSKMNDPVLRLNWSDL